MWLFRGIDYQGTVVGGELGDYRQWFQRGFLAQIVCLGRRSAGNGSNEVGSNLLGPTVGRFNLFNLFLLAGGCPVKFSGHDSCRLG